MVRLIPINIKPVVILFLFLLPSLSLLNPFTKQSMPKVMVTIRPIIMSIGVNASSHPSMLLPATTIKKPRPKVPRNFSRILGNFRSEPPSGVRRENFRLKIREKFPGA